MTTQFTKIEMSDFSAFKVLKNIFVTVALLVISGASQAASFSDTLTETTSDPNLYYLNPNPGYSAKFTGTGLTISNVAGSVAAMNYVGNANISFSGNFQVSVDVSGMTTSLNGGATGGLGINNNNNNGQWADVYGWNNFVALSNNYTGTGLSISASHIAGDQYLLSISGNTNGSQYSPFLLLGSPGGSTVNTVTFTNFNLTADNITGVVSTPIPAAFWLVGTVLLGIFGFVKRADW